MADMETEEEDSQEDSFVDGQQNVQLGEAETLERVRNLFCIKVPVDPVDPIAHSLPVQWPVIRDLCLPCL